MSWFDASGFSSFAKSALNQAQKSIDRVLDIDERSNETISRSSAPDSVSVSGPSIKDASTPMKQSSLSLSSRSSKSLTKNTSPVKNNSNDSTSEGNSFWSSFLGDSSSNTTATESKGSSRRTSTRKLGSRVDQKPSTGKHRASKDAKGITNTDIAKERENSTAVTASLTSLNQKKYVDEGVKKAEPMLEKSQGIISSSDLMHQEQMGPKHVTVDGCHHLYGTTKDTNGSVQNVKLDTEEIKSTLCDTEPVDLMRSNAGKSSHSEHSANSLTENKSASLFQDSTKNDKRHTTSESQNIALLQDAHTCTVESGEEKEENNCNEVKSVLTADLQSSTHALGTVESATVETAQQIDVKYDSSPSVKTQCGQEELVNAVKSLDGNKLSGGPSVDEIYVNNEAQKKSTQSDVSDYHDLLEVEPRACSTPNSGRKGPSTLVNEEMNASLSSNHLANEPSFCLQQGSEIDGQHLCHPAEKAAEADCGKELSAAEVIASGDTVFDRTEEVKENTLKETSSQVESQEHLVSSKGMKSYDDGMPKEIHIESKEMGVLNTSQTCRGEDSQAGCDTSENNTNGLMMQIEELNNEVASLKKVVEVRETKLIHLSKENMDLQEATNILRSQLEQAEAALKVDGEDIDEVRQEFTVRVSAAEKKCQAAIKERDQLKALLEETEKSLHSRNERQLEEFTILLKEKDDQIAQLLGEGENLSKQQLQSNNIIKKLRAKEKESDAFIKKSSKELEEMKSENTRLTEILEANEETERKQADAINKLNAYVQKQDEQVNKQKSELEDAAEKIRSMQNALDNAYKQLADLHKANASKESVAQEALLSAEMKAKEELRIAMEKKERQLQSEMEGLELQITDLQTNLRRSEQQACRREDNLRQEVIDIQQRLQDAEARNQELTESVTHATRPLLRQIENLQSSYGNQTVTWERVERNLTERLNEAQMQLVEAQEKERVATEHALELTSRVATVEAQLSTYRQDKSRLEAAVEVERARLEAAEEAKSRETAKFETLQSKHRKLAEDWNVEKTLLEQQLAVERGKMETEKKKFQNAMDEKERHLLRQTSFSGPGVPSSPSARDNLLQDELADASPSKTFGRQSSSNSIVDGIPKGVIMGAGTALVERLQAQVREKDGEIEVLQEQITSLEKTRDSVTEELTTLTSRLETTEKDSHLFVEFKTRYKDLEQRHNAVLQMYGEKAEEAEELRMDLEDVKSMYKSQIQELLGTTR